MKFGNCIFGISVLGVESTRGISVFGASVFVSALAVLSLLMTAHWSSRPAESTKNCCDAQNLVAKQHQVDLLPRHGEEERDPLVEGADPRAVGGVRRGLVGLG